MHLPVLFCFHIVSCFSIRVLLRDVRDLTDLEKQKADSPNKHLVFLGSNFTSAKTSTLTSATTSTLTSATTSTSARKQARRVGPHEYDKSHMLWRNTNTFVNVQNNTANQKHTSSIISSTKTDFIQEIPVSFSSSYHNLHSSTPSSIEFYYSYETDEQPKPRCVNGNCNLNNTKTINVDLIRSPNTSFILFHISGPLFNQSVEKKTYLNPLPPINKNNKKYIDFSSKSMKNPANELNKIFHDKTTTFQDNKNYFSSPKSINTQNTHRKITLRNDNWKSKPTETTLPVITELSVGATTEYDKIKFFEMYDKQTPVPLSRKSNPHATELDNKIAEEIQLEHVDQRSHEHNVTKFSKKHVVELDLDSTVTSLNTIILNNKQNVSSLVSTERQFSTTSYFTNRNQEKSKSMEYRNYSYENKTALWSEYPFAAVYIYEPSQVHCDAASISAHWLVTSGSCLSHVNQRRPALGEGRSAFVAYCGDSWWQPGRIAYVKYSLVHPSYHPRDRTRKHLYNIGVIQVVSSMMSACSDWAPVSFMSHQFVARPGGSEALALGWGLDRYDTRYAATDLPKAALMIYKGLVFSDSCPGNVGYRLSMENGLGRLKCVYCLSLPPYAGEERDPVHGSLLLVGGNLIALYLQEERRRWGEQSAQYTGIWRLIPWVAEVAKEPDEMEVLMLEML